MREIDNIIRLITILVTVFVIYIIATVILTILSILNEISKILNQFPSSITFTPFNPESFIIGLIIVGIIAIIMKAVTD